MGKNHKTSCEILGEMDWKAHWAKVLKSSSEKADKYAEARRIAREKHGQREMD